MGFALFARRVSEYIDIETEERGGPKLKLIPLVSSGVTECVHSKSTGYNRNFSVVEYGQKNIFNKKGCQKFCGLVSAILTHIKDYSAN